MNTLKQNQKHPQIKKLKKLYALLSSKKKPKNIFELKFKKIYIYCNRVSPLPKA